LITQESETVYSRISSLLPTLRHLAVINVNETQCEELVDILEELTSYVIVCIFDSLYNMLVFNRLCHLEGDENEPHKQNQRILYNTGQFLIALS